MAVGEDIERDLYKALLKAKEAFWGVLEKAGWDLDLEYSFSVRQLDCEGRTLNRITIDSEEKAEVKKP